MDLILSCLLNSSGLSRAGQEFYRLFRSKGLRIATQFIHAPSYEFVEKDLAKDMLSDSLRKARDPVQMIVGVPGIGRGAITRRALVGSMVVEGRILARRQRTGVAPMDCVMAPSTFCRSTFLRSGLSRRKVFLVPYPLDSSRWNRSVAPNEPPDGRFRFLFMNTLYERKGWDVLLGAWLAEFSDSDPVELVIKTYRESSRPPAEELIAVAASKMGARRSGRAPITVIDRQMHDEELPGFMRSFDALVSPHRSEGFGMNPWYAMALGVPVVCTDYGGVTDFAKDDTAWMVPVMGFSKPSAEEAARFPDLEGMDWAEPDGLALRRVMREVFEDGAARRQRADNAAAIVSAQYSWDLVFEAFGDALRIGIPEVWEGILGEIEFARFSESVVLQDAPHACLGSAFRMPEI